ncbi:MAG: hypothetical protein Q4F80_02035 [bacterium]|nr:hypothetical protein [bacterium]
MKRFFIIAFIMLGFGTCYAAIDDNIDYDFINNAFTNPNPTTNKDFENVMQQYEHPREGFFTKMFKFFDKDKAKYDEALKTRYENPDNQPTRIKDVPEEKPTVLISANSTDSKGNEVSIGYYQVGFKKLENGKYSLELMQGSNRHVAELVAREIDEDEKAPSIVYGRAETLDNGYIKVIYANLDVTLLGYLKIKQEIKKGFEPLY